MIDKKFSVLMSVYYKDNPLYLKEALNSIYFNQTLKPDQIVIVQDGHLGDEIREILGDFQKKTHNIITLVSLKNNVGLGRALQEGLKYCRNDLIARMDSDDISLRNRFETQIDYMISNPNVSVLGGFIEEFISDKDKIIRIKEVPTTSETLNKVIKKRNPINHMTVVFRKKVILKHGGYEHLELAEDYYLWIKLFGNNVTIVNLPQIFVKARLGHGFIRRRSSKKIVNSWKKIQKRLIEYGLINKFGSFLNIIKIYTFIYSPSFIKKFVYNVFLRKKRNENKKNLISNGKNKYEK